MCARNPSQGGDGGLYRVRLHPFGTLVMGYNYKLKRLHLLQETAYPLWPLKERNACAFNVFMSDGLLFFRVAGSSSAFFSE